MLLNRRHFVQAMLGAAGSLLLPSASFGAPVAAPPLPRRLVVGLETSVCVVSMQDRAVMQALDIGFKPHSFIPHPENPERLWVIERSRRYDQLPDKPDAAYLEPGRQFRAIEVDIRTMKKLREISVSDGAEFRGHGFFAPGTHTLFIGRTAEDGRGFLTGFDIDSGKVVHELEVPTGSVHDCQIAADGTAWVASSGMLLAKDKTRSRYERVAKGGLAQLDVKTGKTLSFTPIDDDAQLPGHFHLLNNGKMLMVAQADDHSGQPGRVFFGTPGSVLQPVPFTDAVPPGQQGEMFGIAVNEARGIAAISNYVNDVVIIMDIEKGVFLRQFSIDVLNVNFDQATKQFVANGGGLTLLDAGGEHAEPMLAQAPAEGRFHSGHSYFM